MGQDGSPAQLPQRVERARRVVSHCSQAAIRAYDEEALLAEACRTLLDVGDYCMAWFGESLQVAPAAGALGAVILHPLAHAGAAPSGVRNAQLPWTTDKAVRSPTMRALREQRPYVLRGISTDPSLSKRHPEAFELGYASVCAFPVQFGPHGAGSLTIYAREPDAFAPEEVALLRELAGDMGVGVSVLRAKQANEVLEEQLELAERRLRSLIEHAPVAIVKVDLAGQVLLANQALATLLGYETASEVMALTTADMSKHLSEADLARTKRLVAAGDPYPAFTLPLRRLDGSQVWVEAQIQSAGDADGRILEAFVRDLTAERAAQVESARLTAIVNSSEDSVIGLDLRGVIEGWSQGSENMYGFTAAEARGRLLADLVIPEEGRAAWEAVMADLALGRRIPRFEMDRVSKTGAPLVVSIAASPILDANNVVVGASTISHDVSERKRAEVTRLAMERQSEEVLHLKHLNRLHTEFMGNASHELNTPLTPIILQIQAMKDLPDFPPAAASGLSLIERNVLRLATLVKDLLAASGLKSAHVKLNPSRFDLSHRVADAVTSFRPQAADQGVLLEVASPGPVSCFADGERVIQVLFNLVGNAIKFTPRGGSVVVRTDRRDGAACVTVADTGMGFPEASKAALFQPFSRLHAQLPGTPAGTGLGLFISRGIVEESGGRMWGESPGPGRGSTFGFTLPESAPLPAAAKGQAAGRGIVATSGFDGPHAAPEAAAEPLAAVAAPRSRPRPPN